MRAGKKASRSRTTARRNERQGAVPRYRFQEYLCSPGEFRFCRVLREAIGGDYIVMMKVRAAALLACPPDRWDQDGRRVSQKEFDFVLVRTGTSRVVTAIELDDRSHNQRDRRQRDRFLDEACKQAGLPLIRFKVQRRYDPEEIRNRVLGGISDWTRRSA